MKKEPGVRGQRRWVRIAAVTETFPGSTHDDEVYDRTGGDNPTRSGGVRGHGGHRDRVDDPAAEAPRE